jgi:hypothetical protein
MMLVEKLLEQTTLVVTNLRAGARRGTAGNNYRCTAAAR